MALHKKTKQTMISIMCNINKNTIYDGRGYIIKNDINKEFIFKRQLISDIPIIN